MRMMLLLLLALGQIGIAGCVSAPKTADQFRTNVTAFFIPNTEKFEANRPFKDVVETFRKLAPKCLDKNIQGGSSYAAVFNNWNPALIVTDAKAELHLQRLIEKGVMRTQDQSEKGDFILVADITPAGADKTNVIIYMSSTRGVDNIAKALRNWAEGADTACPDLAKI